MDNYIYLYPFVNNGSVWIERAKRQIYLTQILIMMQPSERVKEWPIKQLLYIYSVRSDCQSIDEFLRTKIWNKITTALVYLTLSSIYQLHTIDPPVM